MKFSIKYISVLLTVLCNLSCDDDFVTVTPQDILTEANFFITESDAQSALYGVYGMLQDQYMYGNVMDAAFVEWQLPGDVFPMDGNSLMLDVYSLNWPPSGGIFTNTYTVTYKSIGRANLVINRVGQMNDIDEKAKSQIIAQAKFLRSLFYYRLVTYFGGVPLIVEELDGSSDLEIPRASADKVWEQIELDLNDAIAGLPNSWDENNAGKATKLAALALLGKVYLWQENWSDVISVSEEIITTGENELLPNFRDVFRETNKNNAEILFSTQYRKGNEGEGNNLDIRTAPRGAPSEFTGRGAWSNFVPEKIWVDSFEKDEFGIIKDNRYWDVIIGPGEPHQDMTDFVMPLDVPPGWSISGYILTKYWEGPTIAGSGDNPAIIRYPEVLLNYAEALNEMGRSNDAMVQVNLIRDRAGLDPMPLDLSKDAVLDAIFHERRMEFIWELPGGYSDLNRRGRFIDFIRINRPDFEDLKVDQKPWLQYEPIVFPIPSSAWNLNKAIEQNPGYPPF